MEKNNGGKDFGGQYNFTVPPDVSQQAYVGNIQFNGPQAQGSDESKIGRIKNGIGGFFHGRGKQLSIYLIIFAAIAGIGAASVFGLGYYEKYYRSIQIEKILPGDSDVIMQIAIDPGSQQFLLLEENAEKFPGYGLLKKEIDDSGEGKTLSQLIQDKFKELNLDFQEDIKSVISQKAYVIIPDISPLGKSLNNKMMLSVSKAKSYMEYLLPWGEFSAVPTDKHTPEVLGRSITPAIITEGEKEPMQLLDFISASQIKDIGKAKDVLDRMKKDSKYEVTKYSSEGYQYFKVKLNDDTSQGVVSKYFNCQVTFHALVGKNWIMASREQDIKDIISRAKNQSIIGRLSGGDKKITMQDDHNYSQMMQNLSVDSQSKDSLLTLYYKINFNDFFKDDCKDAINCDNVTEYLRYPEDIISGVDFRLSPEGLIYRTSSNQNLLENMNFDPITQGLSTVVPEKQNGKWTDLMAEHGNLQKIYYNFKKNNLTDKGREDLNQALSLIRSTTAIDVEADFIDQFESNVAWVMFTGKKVESEGVLAAKVIDRQRMLDSLKKVVDFIKMASLSTYMAAEESYSSESYQQYLRKQTPAQRSQSLKKQNEIRLQAEKIRQSVLVETDTPFGKIYSYKLPGSQISFDYGIENNILIFGSYYEAVKAVLQEINGGGERKLADNEFYKMAKANSDPEAYFNIFFHLPGIWNAVEFSIMKMQLQLQCLIENKGDDEKCQQIDYADADVPDELFAFGSIFRTMKIANYSSSLKDGYMNSTVYLKLESLPDEEKARAEKIFRDIVSGVKRMNQKSSEAGFKAAVSGLVPKLLVICDERKINQSDLELENDKYYNAVDAYKSLSQDCGPGRPGIFSAIIQGTGDFAGLEASCTQNGCKFNK